MYSFIKFLGLLALGVLSLCSCRSVRYLPSESVHDTIVKVNDVYHASTVHDSVYIKEYSRGDTVYLDRWHRTILKDTLLAHDTLYIAKSDTIRVPVEVEKKQSWWQRNILTPVNNLLILVGVVFCCLLLWMLVRKIKSNT